MKATGYDSTIDEQSHAADVLQRKASGRPPSPKRKGGAKVGTASWQIAALLLLSAIPLAFGLFRLRELASGAEITPDNVRFFASPLPVVVHIVSAIFYAILGAFQFASGFRRRWPLWHRVAGRVLIVCGLLVGLSGLWMTLFYPATDHASDLLYVLRLLFGAGMVGSVLLGFITIRQGKVLKHHAWMARAYAIGLGAGTQVLTLATGEIIAGPLDAFGYALLMGAAWVINLAVAEWVIYQRIPRSGKDASLHPFVR